MRMIKQIFTAARRFNHNIWMASLDSSVVTAAIGVIYCVLGIVALILIITWPFPVLTAIFAASVARLVYAGLTAR
jgi:hypothetical protein